MRDLVNIKKWVRSSAVIITGIIMLSGCYGTKYLKNDEKLLVRQKITGNENFSKDEISAFYQQSTNRRFLGVASVYVWLYETGKKSYDPEKYQTKLEDITIKYDNKYQKAQGKPRKQNRISKRKAKKIAKVERTIAEGNLLMRWGEEPAVLDTNAISKTNEQIHLYMTSKGFFRSENDFDIVYKNKKAFVTYTLTEREPYLIDSVVLESRDKKIEALIASYEEESLIQEGEIYDQANLTNERDRIEDLLRDNGYFGFSKRFIDFEVDTTIGDKKIAVRTLIENEDEGDHRIFKIDSIIFTTDANVRRANEARSQFQYNGITYNYFDDIYSFKVLDRRIFLRPGELYSRTNTLETQQQIANMDVFRFVNINYDSTGGKFVANVFASPRKRQQFTSELGLTLTYGFPGPFLDLGYVVRNVFHGLENLQFNLRGGVEGVPSATDFTNILATTEGSFNVSLIFPQFLIPGSAAIKNRYGRSNPKTRLSTGFSINDRPEYNRRSVDAAIIYSWANRKRRNFSLNLLNIRFINTDFKDSTFLARLEELQQEGNNLINSFLPSYVSSTIFSAAYNFGEYGIKQNTGAFLRFGVESGGTFLNIFGTEFLTSRNLEYYKYLRGDIDFRKRVRLSSTTTLAYKTTVGMAYPYGDNEVLPYEKYFFSGGATSNRAWRPRRLGPGSYTPTDSEGNVSYAVEQPGEILFEAGVELRQDFSNLLEGALFVDAGNIWVIRDSDSRKALGGGLQDFHKEIALGAGAGIRFDFNFFLFRIDAAFKIYDPARQDGNRFIWNDGYKTDPVNAAQGNEFPLVNFAIGYPF